MGEAHRRKLRDADPGAKTTLDSSAELTPEQNEFLRLLSQWSDEGPWEAPPAETREVPASEVMFYLVDTLTLWNVVGGVSEERANRLFDWAQTSPASLYQRAPGLAGHALLKASTEGARLHDFSCQNALTFAGFYMACTETYAEAKGRGFVRGHWFALLYHLGDGSRTVRPFFLPEPARRKLSPTEHVNLVLDVMARDLHSRTSTLSQRIHAAGGLKMAKPLRGRIAPHQA